MRKELSSDSLVATSDITLENSSYFWISKSPAWYGAENIWSKVETLLSTNALSVVGSSTTLTWSLTASKAVKPFWLGIE